MITLQQIQELRSRIDTLRLSLIELREENSALKAELQASCEQVVELEAQLQAYQQDDEHIQAEFNSMVEDLEKDSEVAEADVAQEQQHGEHSHEQQYAHSG